MQYLGTMEAYAAWAFMIAAGLGLFVLSTSVFRAERNRFNATQVLLLVIVMVALFLGNYALLYRDYGLLDGETPVSNPNDFLYFSIVTWTTLGYGDLRPAEGTRLVAASEALIGYAVMVIAIAVSGRNIERAFTKFYAGDEPAAMKNKADAQGPAGGRDLNEPPIAAPAGKAT